MAPFHELVAAHVVTGTVGLISLWGPVVTRNGSKLHKWWGRAFVFSMLATGTFAVGISICSLIAPLETHPFSDDAPLIRGLFGWMMLYLGVLTVAMAWHCYTTVRHKRDRAAYSTATNIGVQVAMGVSALNCAVQGVLIDQYLMVGVAVPGAVAAILNGLYLVQRNPMHDEWLVQHFRTGIGAGISVYTAFLAFGAVNWFPALAFNPVLWTIPTVLGVGYMIYHQWRVFRQRQRRGLASEMVFGRLLESSGLVRP
ncbi:MAG: hypothetical protein AAGC70_10545 [Pseudomonadota bacterium]